MKKPVLLKCLALLAAAQLLVVQSAVSQCVSPSSLVNWWRGEANAIDSIGYKHGTMGTVTFGPGKVGQAFYFDGTAGSFITTSKNAPSGLFTVEAWVKFTGTSYSSQGSYNTIVEFGNDAPWFGVLGSGALSYYPTISGGTMPVNQWAHVAYTWDGTTSRLYIDGAEVASNTTPPPTSGVGMGMGYYSSDTPWLGYIDELSIFSRNLSGSEIQAIYEAGSAGKCASLIPSCVSGGAGMVGWWSGNLSGFDKAGNSTAVPLYGAGYEYGKVAEAFTFDGISQYAVVPVATNVNFTSSFTWEMWVYPSNLVSSPVLISKEEALNQRYGLQITSGGALGGYFDSGSFNVQSTNGAVATGAFSHVAYVFDDAADQARLYVNGALVASNTVVTSPTANTGNLEFGRSGLNDDNYLSGMLDEVTAYNRALSGAEIAGIYGAGVGGKCDSLATISGLPAAITNNAGSKVTLSAAVTSTFPRFMQWKKNGVVIYDGANISGTSSSTLIIDNVVAADDGIYTLEVSNSGGTVSSSVQLTVVDPVIIAAPSNVTTDAGLPVSFSVTATGTFPLSYVWKKGASPLSDGGNISGSTTSTLTLNNVQPADAANYTVEVSNYYGTKTTATASLSVNPVTFPVILTQPVAQTVNAGTTAGFNVVAKGGNLVYRWKKGATSTTATNDIFDGPGISGSASPNLSISSASSGDGVFYRVVISNASGTVTSSTVKLTVNDPAINGHPFSQVKPVGTNVTFAVAVGGTGPFTYQWKKGATSLVNGGRISGATSSVLTITGLTTADSGVYKVTVTNSKGSVTSSNATLSVVVPPTITTQPVSQIKPPFSTVNFTVGATGTAPLTYQWKKDGYPVSGASVLGANTSALTISSVNYGDSGTYTVEVSNGGGFQVSAPATLTVSNANPVISVVAPTNTTFPAPAALTITVNATDSDGPISLVQIYIDGIPVATFNDPETSTLSATVTNLPAGDYMVNAMATDYVGGVGFSSPKLISVTADCVLPPNGIISWWRGDSTNDFFGKNNGALNNGALDGSYGKVGSAFMFDGYDDVFEVPNSATLNFNSNAPISVEMWVFPTSGSASMNLLGKSAGCAGSPNYQIRLDPFDGLTFGSDESNRAASSLPLELSKWTHIAGTFDGSNFKIYVNGFLAGSGTGVLGPVNNWPLQIGNSGGCASFGGFIDEVAIYNRALGPEEVMAMFASGAEGKCSTPLKAINTSLFGGASDQRGSGLVIQSNSLYISGIAQTAVGEEGIVARFALPMTNGAAPTWSTNWPGLSGSDRFNGIAASSEGLYLAGDSFGRTTDSQGVKESKGMVVKFSQGGANGAGFGGSVWDKQTPAAPGAYSYGGLETLNAVVTANEGTNIFVYLTGSGQNSRDNTNRFFLTKMRSNSTNVWTVLDSSSTSAGGNAYSAGRALVQFNGSIFVAGRSDDFGYPSAFLRKYSSTGALEWNYNGGYGEFNAITAYGGSLYVVGSGLGPQENRDCVIQKIDEFGRIHWTQMFDANGGDDVLNAIVGMGSRLYAVGATKTENGDWDLLVIEIDPENGAVLSSTKNGGAYDDIANGITTDGTDLYVVGESRSFPGLGNEVVLLRYQVSQPVEPVAIKTTSLASAEIGKSYTSRLQAVGGKPPYSWSVAGSLPPGLNLTADGRIIGSPTTNGFYSFTVTASDTALPPGSATQTLGINVVVSNSLPTVSITTPSNGDSFTAPASFTVFAVATDNDGTIPKVEFYQNGELVATVHTSPYTYSANSLPPGSYSFTAVAYDDFGASVTSSPVNVRVDNPGSTVIDFEALFASAGDVSGSTLSAYLGRYGVTLSNEIASATPVVKRDTNVKDGNATKASSGHNLFTENGTGGRASYTLTFNTTLSSFQVTRTELYAGLYGISSPYWRMTAYDALGFELGSTGEEPLTTYTNVPAQDFKLWGDIAWVRIEADDRFFTTFKSPLLDDFVLGTTVGNIPPTVTLTSPTDRDTFTAPATITLSASADHTDGRIERIHFYKGSYRIASIPTADDATTTITGLAPGTYTFRAVAVDDLGAVKSSYPATVTVNPAPGLKMINFDGLNAWSRNIGGTALSDYLANYGVTISGVTRGARVEAADARNLYGGTAVTPPSRENVLSEFGASGAVAFTLNFDTSLNSVQFTRPALLASASSGVSHPFWRARAFDSRGTEISSVSEALIRSFTNVPPRTFELSGSGITSVRFESDGGGVTAFAAVLIDDLVLNANAVVNPLEVSITSPSDGATYSSPANITISANATNNFGGVYSVEFYAGPVLIGTDVTYPYSITWTNVLPGNYPLTAKVIDFYNGARLSAPVNVTVNQGVAGASTIVNFDSLNASEIPVDGSELATYLAGFGITVSDLSGDSELQVQNRSTIYDGNTVDPGSMPNVLVPVGGDLANGFTLNFAQPLQRFAFVRPKFRGTAAAPITHPYWSATAYDGAGNYIASVGESSISSYWDVDAASFSLEGQGIRSVRFQSSSRGGASFDGVLLDDLVLTGSSGNVPPVVSIISPRDGNEFFAPATVTIKAQASDADGSISRVEFFSGTNRVGIVLESPFQVTLTNLTNGIYTFQALAKDDNNATSLSVPIRVKVLPPPNVFGIIEQPQDQAVAVGSNATFSVLTTPVGAISYQWRFNGVNLSGRTNSSLTVTNVSAANVGSYSVLATSVTSSNTVSILSSSAALSVSTAPEITEQPEGQVASVGDTVEFSVSATGSAPLRYQWLLNGNRISGETNSTLTLEGVQLYNAGNYSVVVANSAGAVSSDRANLMVTFGNGATTSADNFADRISINPLFSGTLADNSSATQEICEPRHANKTGGRSVWFTYHATYNGTLSLTTKGSSFDTLLAVYTGTDICSLTPVASDDDSGGNLTSLVEFNVIEGVDYEIAVDGFYGASGNIVLSLPPGGYRVLDVTGANEELPRITLQPTNQTVLLGTNVSIVVEAESLLSLSYQWYQDGSPLLDETNATLTLPNITADQVGVYSVLVANDIGSVTSRGADIQIITASDLVDPTGVGSADKMFQASGSGITMFGMRSFKKSPTSHAGATRGYTTTQIFNTSSASKDPGEPNHCGVTGGKAQWYSYVAPANGTMHINTDGSSYNTVLAVYTGSGFSYDDLVSVACDNSSSGNGGDRVKFAATAGVTYLIAIDGVNGVGGNVVLNVNLGDSPSITSQPQSQAVFIGGNATFTVSAEGSTNLLYQWRFNGTNIAGATRSTFSRTNITSDHLGPYSVVVSNIINTATSTPSAQLTIATLPTISAQPAGRSVLAGTNISLTVTPGGSAPYSYQWRFNGVDIDGKTSSALSLTAIKTTNAGDYSVVVTNVVGAVTSSVATVSVTLPTPTIVSPVANAAVTSTPTFTGTITNTAGVTEIYYRVNGGSFELASGTASWSALVSMPAGTNIVDVKAKDNAGYESALASRTVFRQVQSLFTLHTNGVGSIKPSNGASNTGMPTNGASLIISKFYKLTAVQDFNTGYIFTNWTDGSGNVLETNLILNFQMSSNLTVNANYITNPFIAAEGIYNGLFYEADEVRHNSAGYIRLAVNRKMGYSAKIYLDGDAVSASGKLSVHGTAIRTVDRSKKGKANLTLTIGVNIGSGSDEITGTLTDGVWSSEIHADRSTWNATNNIPVSYTNLYTFVVPGFTNPASGPSGYGYGTVTIDAIGNTTLVGATPDGEVFKQKVPISKTGEFPFYYYLYADQSVVGVKTNVERQGCIMGWIRFGTNTPAGKTTRAPLADNISWIKTGWTNGFFDGGFTNEVSLLGSLYTRPTARILSLTNATVVLSEGNLPAANTNSIVVATNNAVTVTAPNTYTLKPQLKTPNGAMVGSFLHPTYGATKMFGVVLQDYNYARGYFIPNDKSIGQRGAVTLDAAP